MTAVLNIYFDFLPRPMDDLSRKRYCSIKMIFYSKTNKNRQSELQNDSYDFHLEIMLTSSTIHNYSRRQFDLFVYFLFLEKNRQTIHMECHLFFSKE